MKIMVINGPNMNMLGVREKEKYGSITLADICNEVNELSSDLGIDIDFFQSNIEGEIINKIHSAYQNYDGLIINPAGLSYYSVSILDALKSVNIPAVEVHMTNIFAREEFRSRTITASGCIGLIAGFGKEVYTLAVKALYGHLSYRR